MVMQAKKSIGEVLVERGALTEKQLQEAREVQKVTPGDLGGIIQDLDMASEKDVMSARAETLGLKFVDRSRRRSNRSLSILRSATIFSLSSATQRLRPIV